MKPKSLSIFVLPSREDGQKSKWQTLRIILVPIVIVIGIVVAPKLGMFKTPAFVKDAEFQLERYLIATECRYKLYHERHFILCNKPDKSPIKHGYWASSSGLWEVVESDTYKIQQFEVDRTAKDSTFFGAKNLAVSFRLLPVDSKAAYLAGFLNTGMIAPQRYMSSNIPDIISQFD